MVSAYKKGNVEILYLSLLHNEVCITFYFLTMEGKSEKLS